MLYRNGAHLAPGKYRNGQSVAARGFYEVLWRWSRFGCEASQTRRYGSNILHTEIRTRQAWLPRARPRFSKAFLSSIALQRRSNSFVPSFSTSTATSPDTETNDSEALISEDLETPPSEPTPTTPSDAKIPSIVEARIEQEPEPPISHELRGIMRILPSTVVVLTATSTPLRPKPDPTTFHPFPPRIKPRNARGMTLSSFASLALSPEPVITFNIRCPSSTVHAFVINKQFLVHILDASPAGARVADHFTKGNGKGGNPTPGHVFEQGIKDDIFVLKNELVAVESVDKEKYVALPRLSGKGIRKVLRCELLKGLEEGEPGTVKRSYGQQKAPGGLIGVGDHVLVLARVVEILGGEDDSQVETAYGLSYADGKYRGAGDTITPVKQVRKKETWAVLRQ